jgi:hypothetical protein
MINIVIILKVIKSIHSGTENKKQEEKQNVLNRESEQIKRYERLEPAAK